MRAAPSASSFLRKAKQALSAARLLLKAKDTDGACNRAYYAMFDAAHAALFSLGIKELTAPIKMHSGLIAKFGQHVVLTGRVAGELGSDLNKVQTLRQLADYSGDPVAHEDAAWGIERAEAFVAAILNMIKAAKP